MEKNKKILKLLNNQGSNNFNIYDAAKKVIFHEKNLKLFLMGKYFDVRPVTAEIVPSLECNFQCPACTYSQNQAKSKGKKGSRLLDEKVFLKMLDELSSFGVKSLIFTGGGEPAVHPKLLSFINKSIKKFKVGIYTNGLLWDNKKIHDLLNLNPDFVRISVNAGSAAVHKRVFGYDKNIYHDDKTFAMVKKNIINFAKIKKALHSKTLIGLGFIINEKNISDIENIFLFLKDIYKETDGLIEYAAFRPEVYYMDNNYKPILVQPNAQIFKKCVAEIEKYAKQNDAKKLPKIILNNDGFIALTKKHILKKNIAASWSISFNYDGRVYFTSEHNGVDAYCIGDITKNTMMDIWYGKKRKYLLNRIYTLPNFKLKTLNDLLLKINSLGKCSAAEAGDIMGKIKKDGLTVHNDFF